jgi:hypothetical protein
MSVLIGLGIAVAAVAVVVYALVCFSLWTDGEEVAENYRENRVHSTPSNPYGPLLAWAYGRGLSSYQRGADRKARHILTNARRELRHQ